MSDLSKDEILKTAIEVLNECAYLDKEATASLIRVRVPCNTSLAVHPNVPVSEMKNGSQFTVSSLGLLNGIMERLTGEKIAIAIEEGNDAKPTSIHFQQYTPPEATGQ